MKPPFKYEESRPISYWPSPAANKALRAKKKQTGMPLTVLIDQSVLARFDQMDSQDKYPAHKPQNHLLNERES